MNDAEPRPPSLPRRWIASLLARRGALDALSDLDELFRHRAETEGTGAARRWYWRQVPSFLWRLSPRRDRAESAKVSFLRQDVGYALRGFSRTPAVSGLMVATLAIGIGAATAIGSIVYPIVWSPLGYPEEERLVRVWPERHFTQEQFELFHDRARSFEGFSGLILDAFTVTGDGEPALVRGAVVTAEHFDVFGVEPLRGRAFEPGDTLPGSEPVAVVAYELWQSRFGGREDILGQRIELGGRDGARRTIVGVAPPGFEPLGTTNLVWVPATFDPGSEAYRDMANLRVVARLAPNAGIDSASAELAAIASSLEPPPYYLEEVPSYTVLPFRDSLLGDVTPTLVSLLGAVGLVLLLCCSNVANLLLARNRAREREVAVRRALGASTGRLARQWLTESLVLAAASGGVGVALVWYFYTAIAAFVPAAFPRAGGLAPGATLAAIGFSVSLAATFVCGIVPALRAASASGAGGLGARGDTAGRSRARWNQSLVAAEIALSLALVVACGLLTKSFQHLSSVETGFSSQGVVSLRVSPSTFRYDDGNERKRYFREVVEAVSGIPGVRDAGAIQILPMTPSFMGVGYSPSGAPVPDAESPPVASYRIVTPGYRRALGIPLLAGRDLTSEDTAEGRAVGLVNETLAKSLLPEGDAVGRELRFEDGSGWFTVVGVIGDVHQQRLDRAPIPEVYVPIEQDPWPSAMYVVAKSEAGLAALAPALRSAVWSVDEDVPLSEIRPMHDVVRTSLATERLRAVLFTSFAALGFLLSAIGVYGVVAYTVTQRTREIGVRMAFGASGGRVVRETLVRNAKPVAYGLTAGLLLAAVTTRSLRGFLYDVPTTDPAVYVAALLLLSTVALVAGWLPARRASRVDPLASLRLDD